MSDTRAAPAARPVSTAGAAPAPAASAAKTIGIFTLAMVSVAAVLSVRSYPSMAANGWSLIFWYLLGTLAFLIPCALVGAELATGWPKEGGVYAWVQEAYGPVAGGIAIWAVFAQNLVWYPTVMSFIAMTLAYVIDPALGTDPRYSLVVMLAVLWGATLFNFLGPDLSSRFSSVGSIAGTLAPAVLLIVLGAAYVAGGNPVQLPPFSWDAFFPTWDLSTIVFASTVTLMFAGTEMAGYQANRARNVARDYPLAMFAAAGIICTVAVLGTLPIALIVPLTELALNGGIMQTFQIVLDEFNLGWAVPIVALLLAVGGLAQMGVWMLGPTLGMVPLARAGHLPKLFGNLNRHGVPTGVLILQAAIGSLLAAAMVLIPSVNAAYWLLSALTTLCLCIEYLPMFASVIRLRYTQPDTPRAYRLPGGLVGAWVIAGTGFVAITFTLMVALFPPEGMNVDPGTYFLFMIGGTILLCGWPLIFMRRKRQPVEPVVAEPSVRLA